MRERQIRDQLSKDFDNVLKVKDDLYSGVLKDHGKLMTIARMKWPCPQDLDVVRNDQKAKFKLSMWHMMLPARGAVHNTGEFRNDESTNDYLPMGQPKKEQLDRAKSGYADIIDKDIRNGGTQIDERRMPAGFSTDFRVSYHKLELKLGKHHPASFDKEAFKELLDLGITRTELLNDYDLPIDRKLPDKSHLVYTYSE